MLLVIKRVSRGISGNSILPTKPSGGVFNDSTNRHNCARYPDTIAFRNPSSHRNRTPFKFKSSVQLTNLDVFIPKGNAGKCFWRIFETLFY
jgi:hypothetical protein